MGFQINNNVAAFNAYRNLSVTQNTVSSSLEKLSSGLRINRAADDAAGLAISEGLRSQVGGLKVAVRNAQDGISVVQTAEGALSTSTSILQRMRDLSVQASNTGGLSDDAKSNIQSEIGELKNELSRIADTTQFNGTKLLDGSYSGKFQVGANVGEAITVGFSTAASAKGLGVDGVDVTKTAAGDTSVNTGTTVANGFAVGTAALAAEDFETLDGTVTAGGKSVDLSTIKFAAGSDAAARTTAVQKALDTALGDGAVTVTNATGGLSFAGTAAAPATFTAASGADKAIENIDAAIQTVSTARAELGAKQNRLEMTIKNLNVSVENLTASESRIRDTDMASEMVSFTKSQILSQAGTAMLAQANQMGQGVLSLLR